MRKLVLVVAIVLTLLIGTSASAYAFERDDSLPGVPIGQGVRTGVVDGTTDPFDVHAVMLFAGLPVSFDVNCTTWTSFRPFDAWLYKPAATSLDFSQVIVSDRGFAGQNAPAHIDYTPAVTGVYFLAVKTGSAGVNYTLNVTGSAAVPSNSTAWTSGAAPGYSLSPTQGKATVLWGKLTPTFCSLGLPQTTANLQESTNTVSWTTIASPSSTAGQFFAPIVVSEQRYYRWVFNGDGVYAASTGQIMTAKPAVPTTGVTGNKNSLRKKRTYTFYGYVGQRTSATIRIEKYNTKKHKYVAYAGAACSVSSVPTGSGFRFTRKLRLTSAGKYRMRVVTGAPAGFAAGSSGYRTITFK
jgi:hypothetical protein